jgi:lysophospholipase L1-like esterase
MSKIITPSDILIIQYTEPTRTEFWSSNSFKLAPIPGIVNLTENYNNDGSIIRFKLGADSWQKTKTEKEFFKMYESNFLNRTFVQENFNVYNEMFQHFLLNYKIPTIFLNTPYIPNYNMLNYFENLSYSTTIPPEIQFSKTDPWHLSLHGHKVLANDLYDHIVEKGMI